MFFILTLLSLLLQSATAAPSSSSNEIQKLLREENEIVAQLLDGNESDSILIASSTEEAKTIITASSVREGEEISKLLTPPPSSADVIEKLQQIKANLELEVLENSQALNKEHSYLKNLEQKADRLKALSQRALIDTHDSQTRTALMRMKVRELSAATPIADFPNTVQNKYIERRKEIRYRHGYRHISLPSYGEEFELPNYVPTKPLHTEDEVAQMVVSQTHPLAVIASNEAPLLAAPTPEGNVLLSLAQGDSLVIEKRIENWYRIVTVSGVRGWIASEHLLFGPTHNSYPEKVVRLKGYDKEADRNA